MFGIFRNPLVAVCLLAFGIFLMVAGHRNGVKFAALRDHGKTAQAEITRLEWKEKKSTHADGQYTAHVRFTTEEGREVQTEVGVAADVGRTLRERPAGATLTVRYLPEAPSTLEDIHKDDASEAQKDIGLYMVLAGLAMLAIRFFFAPRSKR